MQRVVLSGEGIMKREAPVKSGTLRRSITSKVERGGDRGVIGTNVRYARAVHDGTRAFTMYPNGKKALYWPGARHPVKSVKRPARKGNPFMERTAVKLRPVAERDLQAWGNARLGRIG